MKQFYKIFIGVILIAGAKVAEAQMFQNGGTCPVELASIRDFLMESICLLRFIIPLLITLGVVFFIWGVIHYLLNPENSAKRDEAKQYILWAIIGLFVIVSMWGLVQIFRATFGFSGSSDNIVIPQLQVPSTVN